AFDARVRRQTRRTRRTLSVPVAERTRGASSALALPWPALLPGTSRLRSPCRAWLPAARTEKPCTLQTPRKFAGRLGQRGRRRRARTRQTVLYTACPRKKRRVTRPSHEPRVSRQRRGPRRRRPGCLGSRQLLEKRRPKGPAPLLDHRLAKRSNTSACRSANAPQRVRSLSFGRPSGLFGTMVRRGGRARLRSKHGVRH